MLKKYFFHLFLILFIFSLEASETPTYHIHDLGTLASEKSKALKINNEGQIFGIVHADKPSFFIWDEKEGIKMFPLPVQNATIEKVNNRGQTIMKHEKETTGWIVSAKVKEYYFWDPINDQFYQIIPPNGWKNEFVVASLNDKGQFVIIDRDPNLIANDHMSAYWGAGCSFHIVDKKIMDTVIKITNDGAIFGYSMRDLGNGNEPVLCVYHHENYELTFHTFFSSFIIDNKIPEFFTILCKDNGIIAGYGYYRCRCCGASPTYIKKNKTELPIKIEGFRIEAINSHVCAIGWKEEEKVHLHPAYWNGKELFELNKICSQDKESPWKKIETVLDINDRGEIVGIGLTKEGNLHAILLNPISH